MEPAQPASHEEEGLDIAKGTFSSVPSAVQPQGHPSQGLASWGDEHVQTRVTKTRWPSFLSNPLSQAIQEQFHPEPLLLQA